MVLVGVVVAVIVAVEVKNSSRPYSCGSTDGISSCCWHNCGRSSL